jgi:hypothetical protein
VSSTDSDLTAIVHSWIQADELGDADGLLAQVIRAVEIVPQRRSRWALPQRSLLSSPVSIAVVTVVVILAATVVVSLYPNGGIGGPPMFGSPAPTPDGSGVPPGAVVIPNIPPAGTVPSEPDPGELLLSIGTSISNPWGDSYFYADGRLITYGWGERPPNAGHEFVGLIERHLSTTGVQSLRQSVVETGLFESNVALKRDGNAPYLEIRVRNHGQMVKLTWATYVTVENAQLATADQQETLIGLVGLLRHPDTWPADAWIDQTPRSYLPTDYGICFRAFTDVGSHPMDEARLWELLPGSTQLLLGDAGIPPTGNCLTMSTDAARALAENLDSLPGHGIRRAMGPDWIRYVVDDPTPADLGPTRYWIQFGPQLPDGKVVLLGPG